MKLGSNTTSHILPRKPIQQLLAMQGVYGVKKIEIHKDYYHPKAYNDLAILTLATPIKFDSETKKGELQTKNYLAKSKV